MEILRCVVAFILSGGLCLELMKAVATALNTGRVSYGRAQGERVAKRKTQPILFWLIIFVFTFFAMASVVVFSWVAQKTIFK